MSDFNPKKIAVYTVITGDYDTLIPPLHCPSAGVDFICFSDRLTDDPIFEVRPLPDVPGDAVRRSRFPKINSHLVLPEYDVTVYVDANLLVVQKDIRAYAETVLAQHPVAKFIHNERDCLYREAEACLQRNLDRSEIINGQMAAYRAAGFPAAFGLGTNCVLFRRHKDAKVVAANELWWQEYLAHSHRDQLSFDYVRWKTDLSVRHIPQLWSHNDFVIRYNHVKARKKAELTLRGRFKRFIRRAGNNLLPPVAKKVMQNSEGQTHTTGMSRLYTRELLAPAEKEFSLFWHSRFARLNREKFYILDVGCGAGEHTLRLQDYFQNSKITAIEAHSAKIRDFQAKIRQKGAANIEVKEGVIAGTKEQRSVYEYTNNQTGLFYRHHPVAAKKTVMTLVLDSFLQEKEVDLLRLNIGGAETEVITRIEDYLSQIRNIHIEYHALPGLVNHPDVILNILRKAGFEIFVSGVNNPNPRPLEHHGTVRGMSYQLWIAGFRPQRMLSSDENTAAA